MISIMGGGAMSSPSRMSQLAQGLISSEALMHASGSVGSGGDDGGGTSSRGTSSRAASGAIAMDDALPKSCAVVEVNPQEGDPPGEAGEANVGQDGDSEEKTSNSNSSSSVELTVDPFRNFSFTDFSALSQASLHGQSLNMQLEFRQAISFGCTV